MEEDTTITEEEIYSPQDTEEGALWRDIPELPPHFMGAGGSSCLRRWKNGVSGAISGERPCSSPFLLDLHWQFWGVLEVRKEGVCSPGAKHGDAPSPSQQGEGEGPSSHEAPTRAPAATCTQTFAEFRLWSFAKVFFGSDTALRKDSSTLALEKTPVRFNLSFA